MTSTLHHALGWRKQAAIDLFHRVKWRFKLFFASGKNVTTDKITIIVVGRNDNYGGDFSLRLRTTMDWNMRHLPGAELIYVEWNPLADRPSDCEWIAARYQHARCFKVPADIHLQIAALPTKMPVMEYFAKNLGIRNATREYIALVNADVFLAPDSIQRMKYLDPSTIYGTHYNSIRWDNQPLSDFHITNPRIITFKFPVKNDIRAVSGNFILTHKKNWIAATGYDERLNDVRAGVDSNGVMQLLSFGLKQQVLGNHFHLDHPESIVNQSNDTHGSQSIVKYHSNIPYKNNPDWGLISYPVYQTGNNIWELQKI